MLIVKGGFSVFFDRRSDNWNDQVLKELKEFNIIPVNHIKSDNQLPYSIMGVIGANYSIPKFENYYSIHKPVTPHYLFYTYPSFFKFIFIREQASWLVFGDAPMIKHRHITQLENQHNITTKILSPIAFAVFMDAINA